MDTKKIIFLSSKVFLGFPMIIFGLNKFLGFINVAPPNDATAQAFLGAMFTSYLYQLVAVVEIVGGILTLIPRTALIGALLLLPVVTNIAAFHFAHDLPGNGLWLLPLFTQIAVLYFFKDNLQQLIKLT